MTKTKIKIIAVIVIALMLIGLGYGIKAWRDASWVAGYTEREQKRQDEIKANNAQINQLRGANDSIRQENATLRQHISELSALEESYKKIIEERGGSIAAEAKKLEQINEELKNDQAIVSAPADRCVRCRRFSAAALRDRLIDKPLTCADECAGTNQ